MLGQNPVEQCRIKLGGQVDSLFTLPLTTAQIRYHQPRTLHQCIRLGKQCRTAVGQTILTASSTPLLGNPVRVSQRQQGAKPA
ncbi:hypothetical protein D3C77_548160 [compost metagenome]